VRENPRHAAAHVNLAWVLARTGALQDALDEYERLLELEPRNQIGITQKARMLAALGRAGEAIAWLRGRLAEEERAVAAWVCLAELLLGDGGEPAARDAEGALRAAERAVALTRGPAQSHPLALRARARFASGDAAGAEADAQTAILVLGDTTDPAVVTKRRDLRAALRRYRAREGGEQKDR
jgi:tetratricopeptide (TPR) repeat protein